MKASPPNLVITTYRTDALARLLKPLFESSYVEVAPNILMPGMSLPASGDIWFNVPIGMKFDVYVRETPDDVRKLLVNGEEVVFPAWLSAGWHRLEGTKNIGGLRLLPANLPKVPRTLPQNRPLFAEIYSY